MENDMLKLQKEARTDLLTGAMNRAAGTSAINRMLVQELHPGCVNTFAIVDLDNFKTLNDVMGHMWGDRALCEVVLIMKKHCRAQDIVCRLGGDEFVVCTFGMPEEDLLHRVARLRDYRCDDGIPMAAIGCCWSEQTEDMDEMLTMAENAMYRDKNAFYDKYPECRR